MSTSTRSKMAYIQKAEIETKLFDGALDSYDIIFTSDTHECYIISPDLNPLLVRAKILLFDSVEAAEEALNASDEAYVGQIVGVLEDGAYQGCIVNSGENGFYVSFLHDSSGADYVTEEELNERLDAMNFITKEEMDAYVRGVVVGYLGALVPDAMADMTGDLGDLTTEAKSNLVSAINEVKADADEKSVVILNDSASSGMLKTYIVKQGNEVIGYIDIPKDMVISGGSVVTATPSSPIYIDGQRITEGTYLQLIIANQADPIYINVKDLVDDYTAQPNATQVQVSIVNNVISATVVAGSINSKELAANAVTTAKLADGSITTAKLSNEVISLVGSSADWNAATSSTKGFIANKPPIKQGSVISAIVMGDTGNNTASAEYALAEGRLTTASKSYSHAEGTNTTASSSAAHAEGNGTTAGADGSHAEGYRSRATGAYSHAEGSNAVASGAYSHAEGSYTSAASQFQHASGRYNIADTTNTYAEIVGNGSSDSNRSNARTLDWAGNAWYAGMVSAGGFVLTAPNGTQYVLSVDNAGNLTANPVT